jgi:hypothetical protein
MDEDYWRELWEDVRWMVREPLPKSPLEVLITMCLFLSLGALRHGLEVGRRRGF